MKSSYEEGFEAGKIAAGEYAAAANNGHGIGYESGYKDGALDRDEWKRRALEAEEALKKAADIFGDMIEHGRIDTESSPYSYYVPKSVLEEIYAPLQNSQTSCKTVTVLDPDS